jgi:hypothetical protein
LGGFLQTHLVALVSMLPISIKFHDSVPFNDLNSFVRKDFRLRVTKERKFFASLSRCVRKKNRLFWCM